MPPLHHQDAARPPCREYYSAAVQLVALGAAQPLDQMEQKCSLKFKPGVKARPGNQQWFCIVTSVNPTKGAYQTLSFVQTLLRNQNDAEKGQLVTKCINAWASRNVAASTRRQGET